jgi:hypothetical protein
MLITVLSIRARAVITLAINSIDCVGKEGVEPPGATSAFAFTARSGPATGLPAHGAYYLVPSRLLVLRVPHTTTAAGEHPRRPSRWSCFPVEL